MLMFDIASYDLVGFPPPVSDMLLRMALIARCTSALKPFSSLSLLAGTRRGVPGTPEWAGP